MRRLLLISLATIPLAGCQFFNRGSETPVIDLVDAVESGEAFESGEALAPPTIPTLDGDEAATEAESFTDPTIVAAQPTGAVSADLIRSTDPDARARQVQRSRTDPFATLPIPPAPEPVVVPVAAQGNNTANSGANAGGGAGASGAAAASAASAPEPTPPPVRVQPNNAPLVLPSPIAALPPVPQPVIAPTVSVSGVIQMGNEPYAILRSGSEPERYVRVGDRIAGGAVRVKRIETLAFEPRVILEENGIEVSQPISSEAVSSEPEPVASSPSPAGAITPVAAVPVVAAPVTFSSPLPVPAAVRPNTQATLPGMVLPVPTGSLVPAAGEVPASLLLQPAETNAQAVLPNLQLVVPEV